MHRPARCPVSRLNSLLGEGNLPLTSLVSPSTEAEERRIDTTVTLKALYPGMDSVLIYVLAKVIETIKYILRRNSDMEE